MQFKIWIDENNDFTIDTRILGANDGGLSDDPEVTAALVSESNLTTIDINQAVDVLGQALDHLIAPTVKPGPSEDWRDKFRKGLDPAK